MPKCDKCGNDVRRRTPYNGQKLCNPCFAIARGMFVRSRLTKSALARSDDLAAIADGREPPDRSRQSFSQLLSKPSTNAPHLIIIARAGTGKTTTLIEGLKRVKGLPSTLTPSHQQAAVWDAMLEGTPPSSVCFVAFNKSIATELQNRVPPGCNASTMHSLGFKAVQAAFGRVKVDSYRVQNIIAELLETDLRELWKTKATVLKATEELVGLCKMNLINPTNLSGPNGEPVYYDGNNLVATKTGRAWDDLLDELASYYDVELNGNRVEVFNLVPQVIDRCKNVRRDGAVDFDDMVWLPVACNLPLTKYDLLLVDEAQDLNRCQQQLAMKAGRRLVLCGDDKQAIYGFAGADCESLKRMEKLLTSFEGRRVKVLPLTVTRRCGKLIVAEAKKLVPDFEAFETNPDGKVTTAIFKGEVPNAYSATVADGDMCLCRVNAPLVSECFRFLKMGRKANIQGRDVGQGLIKLIKKLQKRLEDNQTDNVIKLQMELDDWATKEAEKENAKKCPNENKLLQITDKRECIECFMEGTDTVTEVISKIETVFTDDRDNPGIKFSSIHKAKGLESKRVFFLRPEKAPCPHPMAKTAWAKEQEHNLCYVAITRAIQELVYVQ